MMIKKSYTIKMTQEEILEAIEEWIEDRFSTDADLKIQLEVGVDGRGEYPDSFVAAVRFEEEY